MPYRIAAIDVHKKMLAVVVSDVAVEGDYSFERRKFGATPAELHILARWLVELEVEEVVMESTAQYGKPVWATLERYWKPAAEQRAGAGRMSGKMHLCQAKSNRGARGRKDDFRDGERMIKRLVSQELVLSYVPDPEQRLWRTVTRRRYQLSRHKVRFQNQLESLLEQGHIKLSSLVSDTLGVSSRRILKALANGETDPRELAKLADRNLRARPEELQDALGACRELSGVFRSLLKMALEELKLVESQIEQLDQAAMELMKEHQEVVRRMAEVPGLGVCSSLQMIAEIGPRVAAFPSAKDLASWVGVCPGNEESAGESKSTRSPKGNRQMRRLLNQAAQAAVKTKGSVFEYHFQRLKGRMEYKKAIWAIAHRLCKLLWLMLHKGVSYEERGPVVNAKAQKRRAARLIRQLKQLGYRVEAQPVVASTAA